jgi:hypothetical protein
MPEVRPNAVPARRPASDAINTRFLSRVALVSIVCLVVVALLAMALLQQFSSALPKGTRLVTPQQAAQDFAAPRLESVPASNLSRLRAEKQALLEQYQWVDREHGIVRIPIEQAMARLVQRQEAMR